MESRNTAQVDWVEMLDEYLDLQDEPLTATVSQHLSIEGQRAMRAYRDGLPRRERIVRHRRGRDD